MVENTLPRELRVEVDERAVAGEDCHGNVRVARVLGKGRRTEGEDVPVASVAYRLLASLARVGCRRGGGGRRRIGDDRVLSCRRFPDNHGCRRGAGRGRHGGRRGGGRQGRQRGVAAPQGPAGQEGHAGADDGQAEDGWTGKQRSMATLAAVRVIELFERPGKFFPPPHVLGRRPSQRSPRPPTAPTATPWGTRLVSEQTTPTACTGWGIGATRAVPAPTRFT
jgi:hypothetical protein